MRKYNVLVSIALILAVMFTVTFSFAANIEKQGPENNRTEAAPNLDRLQQRSRLRDRDCCDCMNDCDRLRLRIHDRECIEELLLYNELQQKLAQAKVNKNNDEIEQLHSQLERVRARICQMQIQKEQTVEQLKLQLKEMIKNEIANKIIDRLRYRIGIIETEIEEITNIMK